MDTRKPSTVSTFYSVASPFNFDVATESQLSTTILINYDHESTH